MPMGKKPEIIEVTADNVDELGYFCRMSKMQTEGNQRKLKWLKARFAEGLRLKMLKLPARGYIEHLPAEYAWRPVNAPDYMFIHCLWVVGRSKGQGYGALLLEECLSDAKQAGMAGVAMVTTEGNWLPRKKLLLKHGFAPVDDSPPAFELMAKTFGKALSPRFTGDWAKKQKRFGQGFTVIRTDQCPYIEDATQYFADTAKELGIGCKVVELTSSKVVRERAPSAYGVFNVVYNGKLFTYHHLMKKDIVKRLEGTQQA